MLLAVISCLCIASSFLVVLNFVSGIKTRNDPRVVRMRLLVAIFLSILYTLYVQIFFGVTWQELGLRKETALTSAILSALSVIILYTGPLLQPFFKERGSSSLLHHLWREYVQDESTERWDLALRNLVVAPVVEEWVFRACMLSMLMPSMGEGSAIVVSPLLFSVCHLHHVFEWLRKPTEPLAKVCAQVTFQACYTFVFGLYAAYLFVKTGHIVGPAVAHVLCNLIGFPPVEEISTSTRPSVVWALYIVGLVAFFAYMYAISFL